MLDLNDLSPQEQEEIARALQAAMSTITPPPPPLEYRAYYGEDGKITTYTTESGPGNYIVVTKEEYQQARHDAIVLNGKLVFTHIKNHVIKLSIDRNNVTDFRASKYDASVVPQGDDTEYYYYAQKVYDIIR